ncbi:hypothetical protein Tco_0543563 [Tanacetum coccineum]
MSGAIQSVCDSDSVRTLLVLFDVQHTLITSKRRDEDMPMLPPKPSMQMTDMELDECKETTLHDVNIEEEMRRKQEAQQEAYDEDNDAQRIQCAQQ